MKISSLSLDSQLAILSELPSHTLLSAVPLVCARWSQLQPHVCRQRRAVKLIIRPNPRQLAAPRHFDLFPAPLDTTYAIALPATFPSVTHLVIYHRNLSFETFDPQLHLLQLLQSWSSTLVSFSLYTDADIRAVRGLFNPEISNFLGRLLALLNQMPRLKRLGLDIHGQLPPSADLSGILSRLVDVELNFTGPEHLFVPQLLHHCSPNLQRLSLGYFSHFPHFLPLLTRPSICSKLERLGVINFDLTQLAIAFDHCSRLRALHLHLFSLVDYAERMHLLTKLPELTELSLTVLQFPLDVLNNGGPFRIMDPDISPIPLPVLPSIRRLTISVWFASIESHENFIQATQLDHVFPQLQQIWFEWPSKVSCMQCRHNDWTSDPDRCIDSLLRPLARLETLQVATVCRATRYTESVYNWLPRLRSQ